MRMTPVAKIDLLFDTILGPPVDELGHFNFVHAGKCLSEVANYETKVEDSVIEKLSSRDLIVEENIFSVIIELKFQKEKVFKLIKPLLEDLDSDVRGTAAAARIIGEIASGSEELGKDCTSCAHSLAEAFLRSQRFF